METPNIGAVLKGLASLLAIALLSAMAPGQDDTSSVWWSSQAAKALDRAGDNKAQIRAALTEVPKAQREEMEFLVAHMPPQDLRSLSAEFLLENVALASSAISRAPWGDKIPKAIYLNDVLPYVNASETRERWRKDFAERFGPIVKDCKSPSEVAQLLNRKVFEVLEVKYSTRRRRADQSPSESTSTGLASCTGLSILLVDACRAVGVPARLAGIPSWVNKRGNHTWVEIWDGRWHFTGACEPNDKGLDRTWFQRDAALAQKDSRRHAIYAVSYKNTDTRFPMVWDRGADPVFAVNVTDRYTKKATTVAAKTLLLVRVRQRAGGPRVVAKVELRAKGAKPGLQDGASRGERSDTNDLLSFAVVPGQDYEIRVRFGDVVKVVPLRASAAKQKILDVVLEPEKSPNARRRKL